MDDAQWVVKLKQDRRSRVAVLEENNRVLLAEVRRLREVLRLIADPGDITTPEELGYIAAKALEVK